jgi:hypothetical protein
MRRCWKWSWKKHKWNKNKYLFSTHLDWQSFGTYMWCHLISTSPCWFISDINYYSQNLFARHNVHTNNIATICQDFECILGRCSKLREHKCLSCIVGQFKAIGSYSHSWTSSTRAQSKLQAFSSQMHSCALLQALTTVGWSTNTMCDSSSSMPPYFSFLTLDLILPPSLFLLKFYLARFRSTLHGFCVACGKINAIVVGAVLSSSTT